MSLQDFLVKPRTPLSGARRPSAWRDLFRLRAQSATTVELWVGIGAFVLVLTVWSTVTELGLVQAQPGLVDVQLPVAAEEGEIEEVVNSRERGFPAGVTAT